MKDINKIIFFASGKEDLSGALIEGKFDINKIINLIKENENAKKDVEVTVVDGFYCFVSKNNKEGYGMFLDNQFVVVGSQLGVNAVKDIKMGKGKTIETKKALVDFLNKVDVNATISGAGLLPVAFKEKCKKNPNATDIAYIDSFCFDFNYDKDVVINWGSQVDKSENVNAVMTSFRGYVSMIKMFASQIPEVLDAVSPIKVTNEGTFIKMNLNIPDYKVSKIKAKLEERTKEKELHSK